MLCSLAFLWAQLEGVILESRPSPRPVRNPHEPLKVRVKALVSPTKYCFSPSLCEWINAWLTQKCLQDLRRYVGFTGGASGQDPTCQCRRQKRCGFDSWIRKISWRREQQPIPIFFSGESHRQRSLVGYSPQGCKELDMTAVAHVNW